jgi:hypothetical protein
LTRRVPLCSTDREATAGLCPERRVKGGGLKMVPADDNGWQEYKKLVLFKVETLEERMDAIDRKLWGLVAGIIIVGAEALIGLLVRI